MAEALLVHTAADLPAGSIFVPTMGALHAGHAALVRRAAEIARERGSPAVMVSIFVNPTQFNDPADLARYPRTLDADRALCSKAGATHVWAPSVEEIYPPAAPLPEPRLPAVATAPGLEDGKRPGHFRGVYLVVKRLFDLVRPAAAVFGEKDWQQLALVRAMIEQERLAIDIVGHETIREPDGLAMSSRNVFLSAAERDAALTISRALRFAARCSTVGEAELLMWGMLERAGLEPEYAVIRDAATLAPLSPSTRRSTRALRGLIACRAGKTRLIDNMAWSAR